jgi:THO complex subunit 5
MTIDSIVTDPALRSFLQTSQHAREQALGLADRLAAISAANPNANANAPLTTDEQVTLSKEQKLLNTNLSHLRGLHRAAYLAARDTKSQTADARHEVDVLHLQLQNLDYEQRHLQGEIAACETHE